MHCSRKLEQTTKVELLEQVTKVELLVRLLQPACMQLKCIRCVCRTVSCWYDQRLTFSSAEICNCTGLFRLLVLARAFVQGIYSALNLLLSLLICCMDVKVCKAQG